MNHVGDYWTVPTDGYSDCGDYALTKRADLEKAGMLSGALRIAIVKIREDAVFGPMMVQHAILLVETNDKTYILNSPFDTDNRGHADEKLRTLGNAQDYQLVAVQDQNDIWRDPTDRRLALNN